ncbi:omptin family outer membrane protease [Sulfurospirillum sp.]|uniref:omptin family outer membrane protease n=1 Tax=Sulfurospirillum sp. TaxID=2053622 RepID=UPI002FDCC2D3
MNCKNLLLTFILTASSLLATENVLQKEEYDFQGLTLGVSLSMFNSTTNEYLYDMDVNRKVSELVWKAKNVKLLGVETRYKINNTLETYIEYKKNISNNNSLMDDYDWLEDDPTILSMWSHHEETKNTNVSLLDIGLKYSLNLFEDLPLWVSLGYKDEKAKFQSYNGFGIYDGYYFEFDKIGYGGLLITFEQEYKGPYIGMGTSYQYDDFIFDSSLQYSPFMNVSYTDIHHKRPFVENSHFNDTSMVSLHFGTTYQLSTHQNIIVSYALTRYDFEKGDRDRVFTDVGKAYYWENSAALKSKNSQISLAYRYTF